MHDTDHTFTDTRAKEHDMIRYHCQRPQLKRTRCQRPHSRHRREEENYSHKPTEAAVVVLVAVVLMDVTDNGMQTE